MFILKSIISNFESDCAGSCNGMTVQDHGEAWGVSLAAQLQPLPGHPRILNYNDAEAL